MLESLIRVCLRGDQSAPVKGQPLRSGISGAAALEALEKANGQGSLQDPSGVFVSIDDKNLAPGIYCFIPAEPGAGGSGSGLLGDIDEFSNQVAAKVVQQQQQQSSVPAKGFSKASSADADDLLEELQLTEVDGDDEDPIILPDAAADNPAFDYSAYPDENAGLGTLQQYHQHQLEQHQVRFGRGGFRIYDIHSQKPLPWKIRSSKYQLSGTADLCVASYGLMVSSAAKRAFIVYEHKQTDAQKEAYRVAHPDPRQDQSRPAAAPGNVAFSAHRGQCITSCLGAYAYNRFPLILDLTDGSVHHLLQVRGTSLVRWEGLTPQQAYYKQAQLLNAASTAYPGRALKLLENIPEEEQVPMKKCSTLRPGGGLLEQLDSVVPFLPEHERLSGAQEIIESWEAAKSFPLTQAAQSMFA